MEIEPRSPTPTHSAHQAISLAHLDLSQTNKLKEIVGDVLFFPSFALNRNKVQGARDSNEHAACCIHRNSWFLVNSAGEKVVEQNYGNIA